MHMHAAKFVYIRAAKSETAPKAVRLIRQTKLKHVSV